MSRDRELVRTSNAATGFTRGWETLASAWAMFCASVRRHVVGSFAVAFSIAVLWTLVDIGPRRSVVPQYVVAWLRAEPIENYIDFFDGRTVPFFGRYVVGRTVSVFAVLVVAFGWLMVTHGQRLMAGRQRRGVRLTTYAAEQRRKAIKDWVSWGLLLLGLLTLPRVLVVRAGDAELLDLARATLALESHVFAWSVTADGGGEWVWLDRSLPPGFYRTPEVVTHLGHRVSLRSNLLAFGLEAFFSVGLVLVLRAWWRRRSTHGQSGRRERKSTLWGAHLVRFLRGQSETLSTAMSGPEALSSTQALFTTATTSNTESNVDATEEAREHGGGQVKAEEGRAVAPGRDMIDPKTPYQVAGVPVAGAALTQHVLVAGSPGSGKSVAILELLDQVRARRLPAVVYDTGEYIRSFLRPQDALWNPADARCVPWTPFAEIEAPEDARAIAAALCPVSGANPFWDLAAATVIACAMLKLKAEGRATNRDLVEFFTALDTPELHRALEGTEAASYVDPSAGPMAAGVRSTVMNRIGPFAMLPDPTEGEAPFSVRRFIRERKDDAWFFFGTTELHAPALRPVVSLLADLAARSFLDLPVTNTPAWWLVLDEVAALHRVTALEEVLPRGRKRGVVVVLGLQSVSQLRTHYGRDGADALLEQPQTWLILRTVGLGAEDLAKILGENEIDLPQESISIGAQSVRDGVNLSERTEHRPVVLPVEVRNFPSCTGVLRLPGEPLIYRVRYRPKDRPQIAEPFVKRTQRMEGAWTEGSCCPDKS